MSRTYYPWKRIGPYLALLAVVLGLLVTSAKPLQAQTLTVLHTFGGGADGAYVKANLILDHKGNLYGTTPNGGASGTGTVFQLSPKGVETVLYSFTGGADGAYPVAGLVRDNKGNLYGTTTNGGAYNQGTVFKLTPKGAETVLYSFTGGADGANPYASLIRDDKGNLYGTTLYGTTYGYGTVFEVTPSGTETTLYIFTGGADGGSPAGGLVRDNKGNLYGTTSNGGAGAGTVFRLSPIRTSFQLSPKIVETVLYSFTGGADGAYPVAGLVRDVHGNLYGTTANGGAYSQGTVFKLTPKGAETVLYSFTGGADGATPYASLIRDDEGNLYGTTVYGGTYGYGTVFEVTPTSTETVLYSFTGGADGAYSLAGLVRDNKGNFYGTTLVGGGGYGTLFMLTP